MRDLRAKTIAKLERLGRCTSCTDAKIVFPSRYHAVGRANVIRLERGSKMNVYPCGEQPYTWHLTTDRRAGKHWWGEGLVAIENVPKPEDPTWSKSKPCLPS
jgi:hypothetical protein